MSLILMFFQKLMFARKPFLKILPFKNYYVGIWYKILYKISLFRSQCDDVDSLTGVNVTCYRDSFLEININDS